MKGDARAQPDERLGGEGIMEGGTQDGACGGRALLVFYMAVLAYFMTAGTLDMAHGGWATAMAVAAALILRFGGGPLFRAFDRVPSRWWLLGCVGLALSVRVAWVLVSETQPVSDLKRGDKIAVRITPFEGEVNGQAVILNRDIKNMPPMIIEGNKSNFDGKIYTYQIKAIYPDGDVLTYSLKVAPAGMTINPSTGLIQWDTSQDLNRKIPITVSVTDGNGGETSQGFTLEITAKARG